MAEIAVGQVWRDLDPRELKRGRTVTVEAWSDQFVFVKSNKGRRSRIHRLRFGREFDLIRDPRPVTPLRPERDA